MYISTNVRNHGSGYSPRCNAAAQSYRKRRRHHGEPPCNLEHMVLVPAQCLHSIEQTRSLERVRAMHRGQTSWHGPSHPVLVLLGQVGDLRVARPDIRHLEPILHDGIRHSTSTLLDGSKLHVLDQAHVEQFRALDLAENSIER